MDALFFRRSRSYSQIQSTTHLVNFASTNRITFIAMTYQTQSLSSSGVTLSPPRPRSLSSYAFASPIPSFSSSLQTPAKNKSCRASRSSSHMRQIPPSPSLRRTPCVHGSTPSSQGGDRFIPSRRKMNVDLCRRALSYGDDCAKETTGSNNSNNESGNMTFIANKAYRRHLMSSLCNVPLGSLSENAEPKSLLSYGEGTQPRAFTKTGVRLEDPYSHEILPVLDRYQNGEPSSEQTRKNISKREIPEKAYRILDLPHLVDDYYLDLVSWSEDNVLAVGLGRAVCLYNYLSTEVQHLLTLEEHEYVTSVSWCNIPKHANYLAVGTNTCTVQLWDTHAMKRVRVLRGHSGRVSSLAWNQSWLTAAGSDSLILQHDVRCEQSWVSTYRTHESEVVGLKWNHDGSTLASGGNDNKLCLWDSKMSSSAEHRNLVTPRLILRSHQAAVKALDWCPFHYGMLASGGGSADRTIKLWDARRGTLLHSADTGSQVSSVIWNAHNQELCSSHGFASNDLILWKYGQRSGLKKMKTLSEHTDRVLSMVPSPDGSKVLSVGADETLRFWDMFGEPSKKRQASLLSRMAGNTTFEMNPIR